MQPILDTRPLICDEHNLLPDKLTFSGQNGKVEILKLYTEHVNNVTYFNLVSVLSNFS